MKPLTIGIDIGGTHLRMGAVTPEGEVLHFERTSSQRLREGDGPSHLVEAVRAYLDRHALTEQVEAVAVGIPGTVSKEKRQVFSAPYLSGFAGFDLKAKLEEGLGLPVFLDRDANFLLYSDMHRYQSEIDMSHMEMMVGLYFGSAVANAFFIHGNFYDGASGVAGEIGHNPLYGLTERDVCGNTGCAGLRCGGKYLERVIAEDFPGIPLHEIFLKKIDEPRIRQFVKDMAIPITQVANILDPDLIFIAGGVTDMPGFPWELLDKAAREHMRHPLPAETARLIFTRHSRESGVLGAGLYAFLRRGA
ncbi:allose kinase [Zongyangia hominis]|uniref:Allose kinase n=1 Tax=Zongyangia hominis TaxID=2763677 RepID=A0A926IC03_9FIRM|nr:allose kinase [Zongyangia hominis]MBC8570707.1 allose kinase [Zongyangia hominis]